MITIKDLEVPQAWYQKEYECFDMAIAYEYVKGKKTNHVIGVRYSVLIEEANQEICKVLVKDSTPIFTAEELSLSGTRWIHFDELELIPYRSPFQQKAVHVRGVAVGVKEVERV